MDKAGDIGPSGQAFLDRARQMAEGVSKDTPSASKDVSASATSSDPGVPDIRRLNWDRYGNGDSGNNSSGGGKPPENPPPSDGASNQGLPSGKPFYRRHMNWNDMDLKQRVLFFLAVVVGLSTVASLLWQTSDKGLEARARDDAVRLKKVELDIEREHTKQQRISGQSVRTGHVQSAAAAPASGSCMAVGPSDGKTRSTAVTLSLGQCLTFAGQGSKQTFFLVLDSAPREIAGGAAFNHMREETEADKADRRNRCMEKTNDAAYCDAEMQKKVGVRVDYCLTKDSPDRCLAYLKGKIHLPLVVHSDEAVTINMK